MPKLNLIQDDNFKTKTHKIEISKPNNLPLIIHQWYSIKDNEMNQQNNVLYDEFLC